MHRVPKIAFSRWLSVCLLPLFCTGCADATEVNRLAIVAMSGFDLVTPKSPASLTRATVQIARPSQLGGPETPSPAGSMKGFLLESGTGINVGAAFSDIQRQTSRRFYLSHRDATVVGEDYARHGISSLIDETLRNPQSRTRTFLLTAYHTQASHILSIPYGLNRLPSAAVVEMQESGEILPVDVKQFAQDMMGPGDPYTMGILPMLGIHEKNKYTFDIRHIAVYQKDHLVGWLSLNESSGFLFIMGRLRQDLMAVHLPGVPGTVSCTLLVLHTVKTIRVVRGKPQLTIETYIEDDIIENGTPLNFHEVVNTNQVRLAIQRNVAERIRACLSALQQRYDADCLGSGRLLYEHYPQVWRKIEPQWRSVYKTMPITVTVHCQIRRGGQVGPPIRPQSPTADWLPAHG